MKSKVLLTREKDRLKCTRPLKMQQKIALKLSFMKSYSNFVRIVADTQRKEKKVNLMLHKKYYSNFFHYFLCVINLL